MSTRPILICLLVLYGITACKDQRQDKQSTPKVASAPINKFELLDSTQTNVGFINKVQALEKFNVLTYRNYYNGGGVAIGDINNDGLPDLYFTSNMSINKLYLNKGNLRFEDITEKAGVGGTRFWSTGVTMADVNGDGWMDIYVCNSGDLEGSNKENELFINNGDLTFTESAAAYGLNDNGYSTHACFFDYDLDGDLDCYVLNNSYKDPGKISLYARERFKYDAPGGDRLYRNDGPSDQKSTNGKPVIKFTNVTKESGIFSSDIDFGLGISVGDINSDGYPDIYISNDFWERDYLYINQKNGTFKEVLTDNMSYTSVSSMGSDIADVNNDGLLDIFSTDMLPASNKRIKAATKFDEYFLEDTKFRSSYFFQFVQNCLHLNRGNGTFKEVANFSGVQATDWSWGALIFDMNQDGNKDIFVSNGVYQDITDRDFADFIADQDQIKKVVTEKGRYDFRDFEKFLPLNPQRNYAFLNGGNIAGSELIKFENKAHDFNLDQESFSNGAAYGDLDNDGDYDLVINNVNMPCFIYRNDVDQTNGKSGFLKIKLTGTERNKWGLGTVVKIYHDSHEQMMESMTARGFQSSVDPDLIFGVGEWKNIDSLIVLWPDMKVQTITSNVSLNQTLTLDYKNATSKYKYPQVSSQPIFKEAAEDLKPSFVHHENVYNDFDRDRLMPHMLSNDGPRLIVGDVNGDKQEDILVLDGMDSLPKLYLKTPTGWVYSYQKTFEIGKKNAEYTAGAFFDADRDGDLDLILGCGGNEIERGFSSFATKFYTNDGKGNLNYELSKGPMVNGFVSCIKPCDFNKDGKMDLFIGCKAVPGVYGLTPRCFLLRNTGGLEFTDVTTEATGPMGMVTDAAWADINNDKMTDLIVVGEWMPITILTNNNGTLSKALEVPNSNGWWNSVVATDIDQDGDIDIAAGNWGLNMKFKASPERPLKLYTNDFDKNGKPESILEWYAPEDQIAYPFASKQDLTAQLPSLKKNSLKYQDYAKKQFKDLFAPDIVKGSKVKTTTNFASSFVINDDNKTYRLESMPDEAQLSPVYAICIEDIDGDGIKDMVLGGNFYKLKPEVGRLDGNWGGYFKGKSKNEKGNSGVSFEYIDENRSGIFVRGEVRDIKYLDNKILIGVNNNTIRIFEKK